MDNGKLKTVNVDAETHKKLKIAATNKGVTIKEHVKDLASKSSNE